MAHFHPTKGWIRKGQMTFGSRWFKPAILRFMIEDFEGRLADPTNAAGDAEGPLTDCLISNVVDDNRRNKWSLCLRLWDSDDDDDNGGGDSSDGDDGNENGDGIDNEENRAEVEDEDSVVFMLKSDDMREGLSSVVVQWHVLLRDSNGTVFSERSFSSYGNTGVGGARYDPDRISKYGVVRGPSFKLSELVKKENNILVNGCLLVDVELQFPPPSLHVPSNLLQGEALKLVGDDEYTDVSFEVGDAIISAHKLILKMNAPFLLTVCKGNDPDVPILIKETSPEVFRAVIRYVYGGDIPDEDIILNMGKKLIVAADRFEVVNLKLAVEVAIARAWSFDLTSATDWLLFADSLTCPLLKECTMAYIVARASDFLQSDCSKNLNESPSLMKEIMLELCNSSNNDNRPDRSWKDATINWLREALYVRELAVDGSREMLISRLEKAGGPISRLKTPYSKAWTVRKERSVRQRTG
ncbi:hypothetical protein ACHAWF_012779 [Thalassiosira exigua]